MKNLALLFLLLYGFTGCHNSSTNNTSSKEHNTRAEKESAAIEFNPEAYKSEDIVFYNLFSPVDMTYLIEKDVSYYNSSLINPLHNIINYQSSDKYALNLGIYGADLSYLWMFNQNQQALSYLTAIQRLADHMEIPRDFVDFTYATAETHSQEIDTLLQIARDSYYETEKYLKETGRENMSALILLGGWIETMYIALNMHKDLSPQVISKVAVQEFSVNSLYKLLQNHQEDIIISEYMLLLKKMMKKYETFNIKYPPGSLVIDTIEKRIYLKDGHLVSLSKQELDEIKALTIQLRHYFTE
jgi:hypothetical protein